MSLKDVLVELESRLSKWEVGIAEIKKGVSYLRQYGYIEVASNVSLLDIYNAVKRFQKLAGLVPDGEMGPKTLGAMRWPRCGLSDKLALKTEFAKWGQTNLTYYIQGRDSDLAAVVWDELIELAWKQWTDLTPLNITRTNSPSGANFILSTGSSRADNFDGPGGVLAWAQLPPNNNYRGQLVSKFDSGETWRKSLSDGNGILLLNVACHEFGHLLGLDHSSISSALMAPFYNPSVTKPVQNDDITRIQSLYGAVNPEPEVVPAPTNLSATINGKNVALSWEDNSTGEDRFEIFRNNFMVGSVGRGYTRVNDINVPDGTHTYKVRAVKSEVDSDWSNEVVVKIGEDPIPQPEDLIINLKGTIESINIPGYRVTKIG